MFRFRSGLFALILVMVTVALARVVLSFGLVAGAVATTLAQTGGLPVNPAAFGGLESFAQLVSANPGRTRTYSVLDVPSELEALRKARGTRITAGGAAIVTVGNE
jgi:hypothetical protein